MEPKVFGKPPIEYLSRHKFHGHYFLEITKEELIKRKGPIPPGVKLRVARMNPDGETTYWLRDPDQQENMRTVKLYLHSTKESAYDAAKASGITDECVLEQLMYLGYEVELTYEIDETNRAKLVKVKDGEQILIPLKRSQFS